MIEEIKELATLFARDPIYFVSCVSVGAVGGWFARMIFDNTRKNEKARESASVLGDADHEVERSDTPNCPSCKKKSEKINVITVGKKKVLVRLDINKGNSDYRYDDYKLEDPIVEYRCTSCNLTFEYKISELKII